MAYRFAPLSVLALALFAIVPASAMSIVTVPTYDDNKPHLVMPDSKFTTSTTTNSSAFGSSTKTTFSKGAFSFSITASQSTFAPGSSLQGNGLFSQPKLSPGTEHTGSFNADFSNPNSPYWRQPNQ